MYFAQLNRISRFHGLGEIISKRAAKYYLKNGNGEREIIIYPSMCSLKVLDAKDKICLPDRMCRYAISKVWQQVRQQL